ncbi:MAG: hypothetical protein LIO95_05090 [Clostridiales bacterium]|nr:hypothetical protein [Clostridiales bacterium]
MYKNHEGYNDPTAGTALGHITGEENRKKRSDRRKAQRKKNRQQKALKHREKTEVAG